MLTKGKTTLPGRTARLRYFNYWLVFATDLFFSIVATIIALFFIEIVSNLDLMNKQYVLAFLLSAACSTVPFLLFQTYKGVIRHSSFMDAGRIGIASLAKGAGLTGFYALSGAYGWQIVLFAGVVDVLCTFFILVAVRIILLCAYTYIIDVYKTAPTRENLLVVDPGSEYVAALLPFLHGLEDKYRIAGFISRRNKSFRINGYKVHCVNSTEELDRLTRELHVGAILFSNDSQVKQEKFQWLVDHCEQNRLRMLMLPSVSEIEPGKQTPYRLLQEVRIEDLLERKEIDINIEEIAAVLQDKVVMVTGAAGSIGSELCRLLCSFGVKQLVMYDNAETPMHNIQLELTERFPTIKFNMVMGDIRSRRRFELICKSYLPQIIYHVAAYKHVPMMENNPCESVLTNVLGTRVVADTALKYGVSKFIMVSTDKAVNPSNVMGASKRIAELYVQSLGLAVQQGTLVGRTQFITTRFGNVLGSNGSVIPRFREQLAKGGPLTVTHPDIIRYFMTIPEACRLVLEASHMGIGNEIFVFDMGQPVKIVDLARRMIQLAGMEPERDIRIEFTGLRPGEKLYEELLTDKEDLMSTFNKQIFLAKVSKNDYFEVAIQIDALCSLAESLDIMETVRKMKTIVPEFISQSSIYENLDGERPYANYKYVKPSLEKLAGR